jgi:hypothetical protein
MSDKGALLAIGGGVLCCYIMILIIVLLVGIYSRLDPVNKSIFSIIIINSYYMV